jgi:hypothetical protein
MIFKVSFKETENNPSKAVYKAGRVTNVILKGVVELPHFWHLMPPDICEWIATRTKVEIYENMANNTLIIHSEGIAKCREDDHYDSILGERLAEARAKYQIYKFFYSLCDKLYEYYSKILFGPRGVVDCGEGSCIGRDLKKYEDLYVKEAHHIEELIASKENG